jgi:TonB family protein
MKMTHVVPIAFAAVFLGALVVIARAETVFLPSVAEVEKIALKHPAPEYPKKARARHISGSGVFALQVDVPTGQVIDVSVDRSTGSAMLDKCAVEALRHWLFRPNSVIRVRVPIAFTLDQKKD